MDNPGFNVFDFLKMDADVVIDLSRLEDEMDIKIKGRDIAPQERKCKLSQRELELLEQIEAEVEQEEKESR